MGYYTDSVDAGVAAAQNAAKAAAAQGASAAAVQNRRVDTGAGLSGGGNLTVDRTLSVDFAPDGAGTSTQAVRGTDARLARKAVNTGTGLLGGGLLDVDRTLSVDFAASDTVSATKAVRADDARLTEVRRSLTLTSASDATDAGTAVGVRIPFRAPFGTSKFRVHVRNRHPVTGVAPAGTLAGTAIGIGTAQTSGSTVFSALVESAATTIQGSFTVPANGDEFVSAWVTTFPLVAGTWYNLTYGYNNASALTNYVAAGTAWTNASPTTVLQKAPSVTKVSAAPLDVWIEAVTANGSTAAFVTYAGQAASAGATYPVTRSSRTAISAFGDSLTDGGANGIIWPETDSWPSKLAIQLPGTTVTNLGFSGATVDELLIKAGIRHPRFTVAGGSVPSSGTVNLTTVENLGVDPSRATTVDGYLGGLFGRLSFIAGGTLTFTTYGANATTAVSGPQEFAADLDGHYGDTAIIWIGRNDVTFGITGLESTVPLHVVGGVNRLVEWLTPQVKQVMIVGCTTRTNETTGQTNHLMVTEINNRLRDLYPGRFKSIQDYLMNQAMTDMGITPTSQDTTNIANGTLPPSVLEPGDVTHISKATAAAVAQYFFAPFLKAKGWVVTP